MSKKPRLKIRIVAVGKIKDRFILDGITEYSKKISGFAELEICQIDDEKLTSESSLEISKALENEAKGISKHLSGYIIVLDSFGKNLDSVELARLLDEKTAEVSGRFCFVIGASHGLDEEIKKKADFVLGFGKQTFPHQLMRLILCEQIYRCLTVINNHPYHK